MSNMLFTILIITILISKTSAIVGGALTYWTLYPGLLVVKYIDSYCSGVLYRPRWLVTAASCIRQGDDTGLIGFGMNKLSPLKGVWLPYDFNLRHHKFESNNGVTINDIGLLRLSENKNISVLIPMPFSSSLPEEGAECATVGWGLSSNDMKNSGTDSEDFFKTIEANIRSVDQVFLLLYFFSTNGRIWFKFRLN